MAGSLSGIGQTQAPIERVPVQQSQNNTAQQLKRQVEESESRVSGGNESRNVQETSNRSESISQSKSSENTNDNAQQASNSGGRGSIVNITV